MKLPVTRLDRASALFALGLIVLVILCYFWLDRPAAYWVRDLDPALRAPFMAIRDVGAGHWWLAPTGAAALIMLPLARRMRRQGFAPLAATLCRAGLYVFATAGISSLALHVAKVAVGRARPRLLMREDVYGFSPFNFDSDYSSLPSGHTNTMVAVALALGYLAPRYRAAFLVVALGLASARVLSGSHYPGDVIAGAALAVIVAPLVHAWFASRRLLFTPLPEGGARRRLSGRLLARLWRRAVSPAPPLPRASLPAE